jgi:hypothetical protein
MGGQPEQGRCCMSRWVHFSQWKRK